MIVCNRALQEELLEQPQPFIAALTGLLEHFRANVFCAGGIETMQALVQVERGFRLSWQAVPVAALQQLLSLLQDLYPNYASRVLVVDLPGYLAWFVRFVKGMLDAVTAAKIELVDNAEGLLRYYSPEGLPSYYRKGEARHDEPPADPLALDPSCAARALEARRGPPSPA